MSQMNKKKVKSSMNTKYERKMDKSNELKG